MPTKKLTKFQFVAWKFEKSGVNQDKCPRHLNMVRTLQAGLEDFLCPWSITRGSDRLIKKLDGSPKAPDGLTDNGNSFPLPSFKGDFFSIIINPAGFSIFFFFFHPHHQDASPTPRVRDKASASRGLHCTARGTRTPSTPGDTS